jgi:hypothetical protein
MFSDVVILDGHAHLVTDAMFTPLPAWYVRAAAQDGVIAAAAQAGTGTCQVVDSLGHRWDSGDVAFGVNGVGIRPHVDGWEVVWMRAPVGATYGRIVLDRDLVPVSPAIQQFPSPYGNTSQGFIDLDSSGAPIMMDQHRTVVCGPLTIGLPAMRGDWTIGQDWQGNRIVAWHAPTQRAYEVWRGGTQTPSHLAIESDGTAVVAVANTAILVPSTAFVPWAPWQAPDEPPARVPTIAPWPCRVAVFFHANSNPSHPLPPTIRSEDGARDLPIVNVDDVLAFATIEGTAEGTAAGVLAAIDRARATGLPLGAYRDAPDYPPELVPAVAGVDVFPIIQAYPWRKSDGLEPLAAAVARVEATVLGLQRAGHARVGIATAYYRQIKGDLVSYNWPLSYVIDLAAAVADLARRCGVRDLYVFEWARADGRDGIVSRHELTTLFARLLEAAQPVPNPSEEPHPLPSHRPSFQELIMSALTLKRSRFREGSFAADRGGKLYPDLTQPDRNLSIDSATGEPRPGGLPHNGPSETFFVGDDRATVDFGTHAYSFLLVD